MASHIRTLLVSLLGAILAAITILLATCRYCNDSTTCCELSTMAEVTALGTDSLTFVFYGVGHGTCAPFSFIWDYGDGDFGNVPVDTHTYADPGDYSVSFTVIDTDGNTGRRDLIVPARLCLGCWIEALPNGGTEPLDIQFTAHVEGGTAPYSYKWLINGGSASFDMIFDTVLTCGLYNVRLITFDDQLDSSSSEVDIRVLPSETLECDLVLFPPDTLFVHDTVFCEPDISGGCPPFETRWSFDGGNGFIGFETTPVYSVLESPGRYTFNFEIVDNLGDTSRCESDTVFVIDTARLMVEMDISIDSLNKDSVYNGSPNRVGRLCPNMWRSLLKFETGALPANSELVDCSLCVYVESFKTYLPTLSVDYYIISEFWNNNTNWNSQPNSMAIIPEGNWSFNIDDTGLIRCHSLKMITDVIESWLTDPGGNYGLEIRMDGDPFPYTGMRFGSCEDPLDRRPYIKVWYITD